MLSKTKTSGNIRTAIFKSIFPNTDIGSTTRGKVIHPTAVYEDSKGDFHILLMNGKQPVSKTDFFVLWHQRMAASTLIQSGKSLREEFHAFSYNERVDSQALVY